MRIVMLTDDIQIDRRILLEAQTLASNGHETIILAGWAEGYPTHEWINDKVKIERVINIQKCGKLEKIVFYLSRKNIAILNKLSLGIQKLATVFVRGVSFILNTLSLVLQKLATIFLRMVSLVLNCLSKIIQYVLAALIKISLFLILYTAKANNYFSGVLLRVIRKVTNTAANNTIITRIAYFNPDILHIHDLPQLQDGAIAKKKLKIPLIYDAHELYSEINTLSEHDKIKLSKRENDLIPLCDAVITVNEFIAEEMASRYRIKKPTVILNATLPHENFSPTESYDLFRQKLAIPKDHYILLFQGWMSKTRGLQPLVKAMSKTSSDIHLVLMGYGEMVEKLTAIVKSEGIENRVHIIDAVPQNELLFWTASADAGIIPYQPVDLNNYYSSPNKLFEYIQANLPMIANDLPFLRQMVTEKNMGIVAALTDEVSYANAITAMFDILRNDPHAFQGSLRFMAKKYHWDVEGEKVLDIYSKIFATV